MAGTIEGGRAEAETIKKKYGVGYYSKIGARGGKKSRNGGFASMLLDSNGLTGPQRAIKFRAWDIDEKAMVQLGNMTDLLIEMPSRRQLEAWNYMQYTGLKDKNGVEIYQGDLVRVTADVDGYGATSYGGIVEVTTKTCGYSFEPVSPTLEEIDTHTLYHDSGELMVWDSSSFWHVDEPTNLEVIGNIYENGNLLEATQ